MADVDANPENKARLVEAVRTHIAGETKHEQTPGVFKSSDWELGVEIPGDRRLALAICPWMADWFVGTSPRNGDGASVEGSWAHWVALAENILSINAALPARSDATDNSLPAKGDE